MGDVDQFIIIKSREFTYCRRKRNCLVFPAEPEFDMTTVTDQFLPAKKPSEAVSGVTVRLAGDSGDGMQLLGTQLTNTSALAGNDVATFPDFPAEIRAPVGTRAGVSGFQVQFSAEEIFTPGDGVDALVVMNPAALVTNIGDLKKSGILIINLSLIHI